MRRSLLPLTCTIGMLTMSTLSLAGNPSRTPVNYWKSREGVFTQVPARHHCPQQMLANAGRIEWWPQNGARFGKDSDARCRRPPISRN